MTPDDIKRLHYYERQFLRTQDFQDEQSYHIEMRRRHLIAHHTWGIIAGLEITQDKTSTVWAVQPGMAVDGYGREIVVFEPEPLNLTVIADQLSNQGLPAFLKIWITYQTELANAPAPGYEVCNGKNQYTRLRESFRLVYKRNLIFDDSVKKSPHPFQDLPDDPQTAAWFVYLGTITWGTDPANLTQNIILNVVDSIDTKVRHYIGAVAAEVIAPDNALIIRGKNNLNPPTTPPEPDYSDVSVKVAGTLQVTNYLTVGPFTATEGKGGIDVTGSVAELGFVKRSLTSWPSSPIAGDRFVWYNPDGTARLWTEKNGDLVTITSTGNVGIGTITPTHRFHTVVSDGAVGLFESKTAQAFLRFQTSEGFDNRVEITNRPGGRLSLWTFGGGDVLNITKVGNVGIGTTTPTPGLKLDIQGDFGRDNGGPATLHLLGSRIGDIGNGILFLNSGGGTISLNGSVGIGTGTAPLLARLHLFQPGLGIVNLFPFTGVPADFRYDGGDDGAYWFVSTGKAFGETRFRWDDGTSSNDLLVMKNNGNVGIGTTNPSAKLQVAGELQCDSNLTVKGSLNVTGSKNFKIPHPLNPEQKYLVHSSLEGSESAVYYRGEAQLSNGKAIVLMPDYFEALTRAEQRTILITPKFEKDEPVTMLAVSCVEAGKFKVRALNDQNPAQKFYWEVKAVRADVDELEVEPLRLSKQSM